MNTIFEKGVTYYKLISPYSGDTTKNCGLLGSEIDKNFYNLRGNDIGYVAFSGNTLILKRLNGDVLNVDIDQTPEITQENLSFNYNENTGDLIITYPNGQTETVSGFTTNALMEINTDSSLTGNGTGILPLQISPVEITGAYSPANEYIDIISGGSLPYSGIPQGYRIVTKDVVDDFGRLYNQEGLEIIEGYLSEINSSWRIPTKNDWDTLLDALEPEGFKNHSSYTEGYLGKYAAQPLKSDFLWKFNDNPVVDDGTCGFNVKGFNIIPVGCDSDGDKNPTEFTETSVLWSDTKFNGEYCLKGFHYDENRVEQIFTNNGYYSIRLIKDYDGHNYNSVEGIFGQDYTATLIPETNQIWTSLNVYATKRELSALTKNDNFIEINSGDTSFENLETSFFINEWNGSYWIKKKMKEGDSIVIISKDIQDGITDYYRRWIVKNDELLSYEDYANNRIEALINELEDFISNRLEVIIKETVKSYLEETVNEIKITETYNGKLKIGFSDDAIFG